MGTINNVHSTPPTHHPSPPPPPRYHLYQIDSICHLDASLFLLELVYSINAEFFPSTSYHLQALRHLYVIAAEKRILVPVDVDSKSGCYVPVELEFKQDLSYFGPTKFQFMAPCMLPDLNLLSKVTIKVS